MDPELRDAIAARLEAGQSQQSIIDEVITAGYDEHEATQAVAAVVADHADVTEDRVTAVTPAISTTSDASPEQPEPDQEPEPEPGSVSTLKPAATTSSKKLAFVLLGVLGCLLVGTVAFAMVYGLPKISTLFGGPPYTEDGELVLGLVDSFRLSDRIQFSTQAEMDVRPVSELQNPVRIPEIDELLGMFTVMGIQIPSDADVQVRIDGRIVATDPSAPDFDINVSGGLNFEPFAFKAEAAYKYIDEKMYVTLLDVPALFEMGLADVPQNTWIEIDDIAGLDVPMQTPQLLQYAPSGNTVNGYLALINQLYADINAYTRVPQDVRRVSASALDALQDTPFSAEDTQALREQLRTIPPLTIQNTPQSVEVNGRTLYQYEIALEYDGLLSLINFLSERLTVEQQNELDLAQLRKELPSAEDIARFNELITMHLYATASGQFVRQELINELYLGESPQGLQTTIVMDWSYKNVGDVTPPEAVYEKTLSELQSGNVLRGLERDRAQARDASTKMSLSNIRSQAEIVYNEDGFSYAGVCEDAVIQELLPDSSMCSSAEMEYVVLAPLQEDGMFYCVDSTGVAEEITVEDIATEPFAEGTYSCN